MLEDQLYSICTLVHMLASGTAVSVRRNPRLLHFTGKSCYSRKAMQLTFRTLKGGTFKLNAEPSSTVLDVKKLVGSEQNEENYSGYRLIYKGKILTDGTTLSDAGVSESGFIVVMPPKRAASSAKPKADENASSASSAKPDASKEASPSKPASSSEKPETVESKTEPQSSNNAGSSSQATPSSSSAQAGASSLVTGPEYDASVKRICEMGFPENDVKRALRAAFNNPDRAVDYLFNGIPESVAERQAPMPAADRSTPPATQAGGTPAAPTTQAAPGTPFNMFDPSAAAADSNAGSAGSQPGSLDFLRRLPQFNSMRRHIQANPSVLPQLLQQLDQMNPTLLQHINANRAEFFRLINEPVGENEEGGDEAMEQLAQAMAGAGGPGSDGIGPGGQIYVTEEENEQITRLTELGATMGLGQAHVLEAWLACDRDENMAANFLFDHMDELRAAQAEESNATGQNPSNQTGGGPQGSEGNDSGGNPPDQSK